MGVGGIISDEESPFYLCLLACWATVAFDTVFGAVPETSEIWLIEFNGGDENGDGDVGRVEFRPGAWGPKDMLDRGIVSGEERPFSRCLLARWASFAFDNALGVLPETSENWLIECNIVDGDGNAGRVEFRPCAWGLKDMLEVGIVSDEESLFSRCLLARWASTTFDTVFGALPENSQISLEKSLIISI